MIAGAAGAAGGYTIDQSIRFNDNDLAYLIRTPSGDGDLKTFTINLWIKISNIDISRFILEAFAGPGGSGEFFVIGSTNEIQLYGDSSGANCNVATTQLFRDPNAWAMLTAAVDTTQATASNRIKLYYNGEQITSFRIANYPTLNKNFVSLNKGSVAQNIGRYSAAGSGYYDGYMAEYHFIDGQALDPTSFGEVNSTTGQWVPIEYTGSYGTNGFYITGEDSADLGADYSGNSNDFTSSGLTSADQVTDTPTDGFCTLNSVDKATQVTLADGNLQYGLSSNSYTAVRSTFGVSSGKWYWEMSTVSGMGLNTCYVGIATNASNLQVSNAPTDGTTYTYISYTGNKAYTSSTSYGDTWNTNGRVIGVALDLDAGKIWWSRDGVWQASGDPAAGTNEAFSGITGTWHPYVVFNDTSPNLLFNFGQSAFTYTPPTGFNTLSSANLPDPTIADPSAYFQTTLYTGAGYPTEVNQSGNSTFQPDFVWVKRRNAATTHDLFDAVRGVSSQLYSNLTNAEGTVSNAISFDADGFTAAADPITGDTGSSGNTFVAWQWKANGSGSSNTDGSITSTVSADTTSGFSIVSYSGNGTSGATVGHGLGADLKMIILKDRGVVENWCIFHEELGPTKFLFFTTDSAFTVSNRWNDTSPTSSVFTLGNETQVNGSGRNYIAYCFAEVEGFSKFGSYTGNGSTDGPFVYTGFKPAFVMTKRTNAAGDWKMWDNERGPYNVNGLTLASNSSGAESSGVAQHNDFLSNGFKIRGNDTETNGSGSTYVYMAFAESSFRTATAR